MIRFFKHTRCSLIRQNPKFGNFKHRAGRLLLIFCICIFTLSANTPIKNIEVYQNNLAGKATLNDSLTANQKWMQAINKKDLVALEKLYAKEVYGLSPNGIDFSERDTLLSIVKSNDFVVKEVKTIQRIEASQAYDYEIGSFKNANDGLMKYVLIWDTSQDSDKRVLEFIDFTDSTTVDFKEIDLQREEWMKYCNAHNAENLINAMYTENTMYYNHRPMVVGRENLFPVYSYMNNLNYQLTLHPLIVEPVSKQIVYEIGQCNGSYNGKYILIWKKTDDGWQVLFDANI